MSDVHKAMVCNPCFAKSKCKPLSEEKSQNQVQAQPQLYQPQVQKQQDWERFWDDLINSLRSFGTDTSWIEQFKEQWFRQN